MAYMIEIKRTCDESGCTRLATFLVKAYRNEEHGRYCERHATQRVAVLTRAEAHNPAGFGR